MATEEQKPAQDASIEDVLSSIKQIVEQESGTKTPGAPQAVAPQAAASAVLELSEMEVVGDVAPVDKPAVDNTPVAEPEVVDINAFTQAAAPEPTPVAATKPVAKAALPEGHVHLTAIAGAKGLQVGFPVEVLAEALRPLIKDWVESNLPDIVERLVKEELAKLADK